MYLITDSEEEIVMGLVYKELNFEDHAQAISDFIEDAWTELHLSTVQGLEFNPDMKTLGYLVGIGYLKGLGGFEEDGKLGTVYLSYISPHIYSKDVLTAAECLWAIRKDLRKPKILVTLLNEIDNLHIKHGVKLSVMCMHSDRMQKLMSRKGYTLEEYAYYKRYE